MNGNPISVPVFQHPIVDPKTGRTSQPFYRWLQAVYRWFGNDVTPDLPGLTVIGFMGLRRS